MPFWGRFGILLLRGVIARSEATKQSINKAELGFQVDYFKKNHFVDCFVAKNKFWLLAMTQFWGDVLKLD
jgi:hypothetical protein